MDILERCSGLAHVDWKKWKHFKRLDLFWGISTLSPPKIVVTSMIFLQLPFFVMYGHHILDYFFLFYVYLINLKLNLINYLQKSNKQWKNWMYGIYLWQNNTCQILKKNYIYTSKLRLWVEFLGEFFYCVWYWYAWIKSRTI